MDNSGKIQAVVVGVGGFLGIGERDVAIPFDQIRFVNEPRATATTATTATTGTTGATGTTAGTTDTTAPSGTVAAPTSPNAPAPAPQPQRLLPQRGPLLRARLPLVPQPARVLIMRC